MMAAIGWKKLESRFYGKKWDAIHGGYFSDPKMARPFVDMAARAVKKHKPGVIVDLGGGAGFVLGELSKRDLGSAPRLINVDSSAEQLKAAKERGLECLNIPAEKFTRGMAAAPGESLMIIMRSVLHYYKGEEQPVFLRHIRRQMKKNEFFLHQTGSFTTQAEAEAMNQLYRLMRTTKAYFTPGRINAMLQAAGFKTTRPRRVYPVRVPSAELANRYKLTKADIAKIIATIGAYPGTRQVFLAPNPGSFDLWFKYYIFRCAAR
jgi:trans-aconitate methyltransferase